MARVNIVRRMSLAAACGTLLVTASSLGAQREPLATDSVSVDVRITGDTAHVRTRYWFPRTVRALDLTYLMNTCTSVAGITATRNGAPVPLAIDSTRPWVALHDTTDVADESEAPLRYEVDYHVLLDLGRRQAIPLIQPSRALDSRNAAVKPKVRLTVATSVAPIGAPEFPRFEPVDAAQWMATTIAVPATIVVRGNDRPGTTPCDDAIRSAGDNDGFSWRFAAFVGTLLLWIPLYFAWARRQQAGDDHAEERT